MGIVEKILITALICILGLILFEAGLILFVFTVMRI